VFEYRVLRKIFGPKMDKVTEQWRRLHNVELHDLCSSPHITPLIKSRSIIWMEHVACIGEGSDRFLVKKSEGKRPLARPERRWKDNVEVYLQEVG
jgi:hypothetical protein